MGRYLSTFVLAIALACLSNHCAQAATHERETQYGGAVNHQDITLQHTDHTQMDSEVREGHRKLDNDTKHSSSSSKARLSKQQRVSSRAASKDSSRLGASGRGERVQKQSRKSLSEILFPGSVPNDYGPNELLSMQTDLVNSRFAPIPYRYYDLPFCPEPKGENSHTLKAARANLGSRLQGHDIKVGPYPELRPNTNIGCSPLCKVTVNPDSMRLLRRLVKRMYRVHLTLDELPAVMRSQEYNDAILGYPIGFVAPTSLHALTPGDYYLYNHIKLTITYHEDEGNFEGIRITGFDVLPWSIQHDLVVDGSNVTDLSQLGTCNGQGVDHDMETMLSLSHVESSDWSIVYSYEVEWLASPALWTDRWDVYIVGAPDEHSHYYSIANSLMIDLFLTLAISTILIRVLRKDISKEMESLGGSSGTENGWKELHGDVFRPPTTYPMLLSVLSGTGAQIGLAALVILLASQTKFLSPMRTGQILTAMIAVFVFCGSAAGYVSSRIYKFMCGKDWKRNVLITAVALPGLLLSVFLVLNVFLSFGGAATAVNSLTILVLSFLWICVSMPLVVLGAYIGHQQEKLDCPVATNATARTIPRLPFFVDPRFTILIGGVLPLGCVWIEFNFILGALWKNQIYYGIGFLVAVFPALTVLCAEVSIVLTHLQLCAQNHAWWWRSFWNTASAGMYLFLYSLWYLWTQLHLVGVLPTIVYLVYTGMMAVCFGLYCGFVGFVASLWFVRKIYGAIQEQIEAMDE